MKKILLVGVLAIGAFAFTMKHMYDKGYGAWKTGDYVFSHKTMEDIDVYQICTERGTLELVAGFENVENSIRVYKENGTYGEIHRGLN